MTVEPGQALDARVEALLRANAELAAEVRSLSLSRASAPRSAAIPAVRSLSKLVDERDSLISRLDHARSELAAAQLRIEQLDEHNQELGRRMHEQGLELQRLRSGLGGLLRRARARLRRRRG
jgi:predicted nuclease with TOPRIM domain